MGHLAENYMKPKRERDSCFECGAMDHKSWDCSQKKKTTALPKETIKEETTGQISNVEELKGNANEFLKATYR